MLKICGVSKSFCGIKILDNVSMEIAGASIFGLAGSSGSGKSTLLRCIQGLEVPDSGTIDCDRKVGFVFQDFQLFPHMTVLQNLVYAPALKAGDDEKQLCIAKAKVILKNLGIEEKASEYPSKLSGGQKQRVALARSLMIDPDVLLCDEPTSGLDVTTIVDVVTLLQSVNQEFGVTIVIASHDLDFLTRISDRIVLLRDGTIVTGIYPKQHDDPINHLKSYYG
ncbi:MAG: ATP-binding cassette domain-containing protein [Holosporales bacterium]|jgi:polar amino acid transport system ATP-binding protein|nr:ATP-binding cassette domain-containing protein [Holosporales bacterium]